MTEHNILINRAPVLTLWATTVAERLGFDQDEALSLGKAVAGLTAQSKGQRLGIYKPVPQEVKKARARKRGEEFWIEICGRQVPAINTPEGGIRPVNAQEVRRQFRRSPLTSWSECKGLRQENVATFNPGEAFFQRQELCYFLPLSGMAEIGEIKPPTSNVLQSGEARFE